MQRESNARISGLLRRHKDLGVMGVVAGLGVSVNAITPQNVDIAPGSGYTSSGELVTVTTTQTNVVMADYTGSQPNYICLFYTEVQSLPEAHEDLATTFNTAATGTFRVRVYTRSAFNALPATSVDMATDAQDRAVICAIVTGAGAGVALTNSSVQNTSSWAGIVTVTQPSALGVLVTAIDPATIPGAGTLTIAYPINASPTLTWAAPTSTGTDTPGTSVSIPADSTYTLISANGRTLTVQVTVSQLLGTPVSMTLTVSTLYGQTVPHFSAKDEQHRHALGSGQPTNKNPHGLTLADLGGSGAGLGQDHQHNWHSNGVIKSIDGSNQIARTAFNLVLTRDGTRSVIITPPGPTDAAVVDGTKVQNLVAPGTVSFSDVVTDRVELYGIYLMETGVVNHGGTWLSPEGSTDPQPRVQFSPAGTSSNPFSGTIQPVNISDNWQTIPYDTVWVVYTGDVGSGTLALAADNAGAPDTSFARYAVARPTTTAGIVRLYMNDGVRWIDVWVDGPHWFTTTNAQVKVRVCPEPAVDRSLRLGYVVSHGTSHVLGYSQLNTESVATNNLFVTRYFGVTSDTNLRDDAVFRLRDRTNSERMVDGYSVGFEIGAVASGATPLSGGAAYIGGTRYEVPSQTVSGMSVDGRWYIYLAVTSSMYVATPVATQTLTTATANLPLWAIDIAGGALTAKYKIVRNISKIDDRNVLTVDPGSSLGQFSNLSSAVEYVRQMRAASKPVSGTILLRPGTLTEAAAVKMVSNLRVEAAPGSIITSPTVATGGTMTAIDCASGPATNVVMEGLTFDVSGATVPIGATIWTDCQVIRCRFTTTNGAANPRGVRVGDGVAVLNRTLVHDCRFELSTSTAPPIDRLGAATKWLNHVESMNMFIGASSQLQTDTSAAALNIGTAIPVPVNVGQAGQTTTVGGALVVTQGINANAQKITGVLAPTIGSTEAANAAYVDSRISPMADVANFGWGSDPAGHTGGIPLPDTSSYNTPPAGITLINARGSSISSSGGFALLVPGVYEIRYSGQIMSNEFGANMMQLALSVSSSNAVTLPQETKVLVDASSIAYAAGRFAVVSYGGMLDLSGAGTNSNVTFAFRLADNNGNGMSSTTRMYGTLQITIKRIS